MVCLAVKRRAVPRRCPMGMLVLLCPRRHAGVVVHQTVFRMTMKHVGMFLRCCNSLAECCACARVCALFPVGARGSTEVIERFYGSSTLHPSPALTTAVLFLSPCTPPCRLCQDANFYVYVLCSASPRSELDVVSHSAVLRQSSSCACVGLLLFRGV